jgi:hypothetical protein
MNNYNDLHGYSLPLFSNKKLSKVSWDEKPGKAIMRTEFLPICIKIFIAPCSIFNFVN